MQEPMTLSDGQHTMLSSAQHLRQARDLPLASPCLLVPERVLMVVFPQGAEFS